MITIRRPVLKQCPFKSELDAGELAIVLPGDAPELHRLAARIDMLCMDPCTHEDFTRAVLDLLPEGAEVVTTWHTGPWTGEVGENHAGLLRNPELGKDPCSHA